MFVFTNQRQPIRHYLLMFIFTSKLLLQKPHLCPTIAKMLIFTYFKSAHLENYYRYSDYFQR